MKKKKKKREERFVNGFVNRIIRQTNKMKVHAWKNIHTRQAGR